MSDRIGENNQLIGQLSQENAELRAKLLLSTPGFKQGKQAEFVSKRLAQVAKLLGIPMSGTTHEQNAEMVGTVLGQVRREIETLLIKQDEHLAIAKQRISELEKDCEILQTNLDAALRTNHAQINNCEVAYKYASDMRGFVIARDAEIERLKAALKYLLADTQHKDHVCSEVWCPVFVAKEALKGAE